MAETDLTLMVQKRGVLKAHLTRFSTFLIKFKDNNKFIELQSRLERIEDMWNEFNTIQTDIELLDNNCTQVSERESFEQTYFDLVSQAREIILTHKQGIEQENKLMLQLQNDLNKNSKCQSNVKLPTLKLPEFDGDYTKWTHFRDSFNALINDDSNLTGVHKFHYLQSCLQGNASRVLSSLEACEVNYKVAWEILKERYENKRVIVNNHISALFDMPPIIKESHFLLRNLLDSMIQHLRALESLDQPVENWDVIIIYLVSKKLDPITKREWEESIGGRDLPTLKEFKSFLMSRCNILESLSTNQLNDFKNSSKKYHNQAVSNFAAYTPTCYFCKNPHNIYSCMKFLKLSVDSRLVEVKGLNLCVNCLRPNHSLEVCRASGCKICNQRHNSLLHVEKINYDNTNNVSNEETPSVSAHSAQCNSESHIILATAEIYIFDVEGRPHKCRALMDCGSQGNFLTNELFYKLRLPGSKIHIPVIGINQNQTYISKKTFATIKSSNSSYETNLSFLITEHITHNLPTISFDTKNMNIPNDIILADYTFNQPGKIDVLLGANIFWELICGERLRIGQNMPFLQNSKLGWIISGPMTPTRPYRNSSTSCHLSINNDIQNKIEMFWKVEECLPNSKLSKEEIECEQHYIKTTTRDNTGRYIVSLPFRENISKLGNSKEIAIKRFYSTENQLLRNSELKRQYIDFMNEYLSLGHMTKVDSTYDPKKPTFYLPHHGVLKESSLTTKLRVVFDGSAITSSGLSLNDTLKVGPTIQDELFSIVIRFRKHRYVITADVTKMYRQINILPEQRNFQRIVWRSDPEQPLEHYNLNTVTYGTASASFLAIRSLHQVAIDNKDTFPQAYNVILKDFYVDDLITGTDSIQNAIILKRDIDTVLQSGGFILRKWTSNNKNILGDLSDDARQMSEYHISDDKNMKTLGLLWDTEKDVLRYKVNIKSNVSHSQITKRFILSTIAQIFDPLGILGPITVKAKIIMQRLWQLKLGWDEPISLNLYTVWIQFYNQLYKLNNIAIPRHVLCVNPIEIQLHGFSDSSELAYGASIFLRSTDNLGNIHTHLLCSKSRVAPLKTISVPRLELCGAQLLAQLSRKVINSLNIKLSKTFYWCDSTIVMAWISMEPNQLKTFVAHRVTEIQQYTEVNQWRHINSHENPSDIISRGMNPDRLIQCKLWWTGPIWLSKEPEYWPITNYESSTLSNIPEIRNTDVTLLITNMNQDLFNLYSSLSKLQRVVAYCLRFINNLTLNRESKVTGALKIAELNQSMISLLKLVQSTEFSVEIQSLKRSNIVPSTSKLISLNPFLDKDNLIRVGGRLRKSNLQYNHKYPVVLPNKHPLTKLIINYEHIRNLHAGAQATLSAVRANYWPLNGRNTVRYVLHSCLTCFKVNPSVIGHQMGDLPESRLKPTRPFSVVGIDYAGPFPIKDGKTRNRKIVKCYLSLFVCFSSKAVHLELVSDLSTDSFLNALKRFVSRRGLCQQIYSDNGTNFVGANNELKGLYDFIADITNNSKFEKFLTENYIKWNFIPPRSPHFGGYWEAAVKSAKYHLRRIVGNVHLTFEELYTLFTQIEAVLNSRPLIPLSSDPNDLSALTPGHFLIGETLTAIPQQDVTETPLNKLSHFKKLQQLSQHFWLRWSRDYLNHLQQRSKWKQKTSNQIEIGSLVLLKDENIQPLNWKLARVIATHPGDDGVIRVVSVKTFNGITKRAVKKICLLPINETGLNA